ncbi:Uncharacterised protein [Mycobacteroides abscessus subsp. abscessus]|nr:Uncharacterised protein [Mycobacteroides abscessus subsp. abscessus]
MVPARGPSSLATTVPSASVTGVISRSKKPSAMAFSARFWLRTPQWSWSSRLMPVCSATFSAVWPIAMYTSGVRPSLRGSCHSVAPCAAVAVRASASAYSGLWLSGHPSEVPFGKRETVSTPAEMNA